MGELLDNVNWLAVIVGAGIAFALGAFWFSPKMFGKGWAAGIGAQAEGAIAAAMIVQAIGTFLFSWVVGVTAASNHLLTIILITLAFALLQAGTGLFSRHSGKAVLTESGYIVTMAVIMILVHAILYWMTSLTAAFRLT